MSSERYDRRCYDTLHKDQGWSEYSGSALPSLLQPSRIVPCVVLAFCYALYLPLFCIALWTTYRKEGKAAKRLRIVTIIMFALLTVHFIVSMVHGAVLWYHWGAGRSPRTMTIRVFEVVTRALSGLLTDGLLTWRMAILFGNKKRILYPAFAAVLLNFVLSILATVFEFIGVYTMFFDDLQRWDPTNGFYRAWGTLMLIINSGMTVAIIAKIFITARRLRVSLSPFAHIPRAVIESAFITWVGLVLYVATLRFDANVDNFETLSGAVMYAILPQFFGISQTLLSVRIVMSEIAVRNEANMKHSGAHSDSIFAYFTTTPTIQTTDHKIAV